MRLIKLGGKSTLSAIVDDEDFELLSSHKWYEAKRKHTSYAATDLPLEGGTRKKTLLMHRAIISGVPLIDHWDGNGLNNQRYNLRPATTQQNTANSKLHSFPGRTSKFKGVYWDQNRGKWGATICKNNKRVSLGRFTLEIDAAKAYDLAAIELFGEFARVNLPEAA